MNSTLTVIDRPSGTMFDIVEAATRRQFIGGLSAAALLAACSPGTSGRPAPGKATTTWTEGPFGPVEVPIDPRRVVACNAVDADFALALGLQLVGASGAAGSPGSPFAEYHADRLGGVERVAAGGEPSLEQVAALRPDVIVDSWDTERARFDDWSALAPTVNFAPVLYPDDFASTDWQGAVRSLGRLFDRRQEAERAVSNYESTVADLRAGLADLQGKTFAAVNVFEGIIVIDAQQLVSRTAVDLGLRPAALVAEEPADRTVLSLEEAGRLDEVDVLLVAVPASADSLDRDLAELEPVLDSPLWRLLPAVQTGRVVQYPGEIYYASPLTAPALAEAIADGLA